MERSVSRYPSEPVRDRDDAQEARGRTSNGIRQTESTRTGSSLLSSSSGDSLQQSTQLPHEASRMSSAISSMQYGISPPSVGVPNSRRSSWQEKLQDHCRDAQIHPPVWNIVSDRRGGRTAWSSTVTFGGKSVAARFWYDGQFVENAKEDAAEVALQHLMTGSPTGTPTNGHR